jgi:hypothetical protein
MKSRRFFIMSLILAVLALSAQLWAMGFASRSLHMRARAITGPPAQKAQALAEAREHSRQVPFFYSAGWAFALGSVALVVVSTRKREPISRSIPCGAACKLRPFAVLSDMTRSNKAPAPNRRPSFPLGGSGGCEYHLCAPPASSAAVGEARC